MVVVGIVSDVVRQAIGTTSKRGILLAYPVLPLGILAAGYIAVSFFSRLKNFHKS